jgi:TonB family protein
VKRLIVSILFVAAVVATPSLPASAAQCPVELKTASFGGHAASGAFVAYTLEIAAQRRSIPSIRVKLRMLSGRIENIAWENARFENGGAFGTFDSRDDDVSAVAIDKVVAAQGSPPVLCDNKWVEVTSTPPVVVFSDKVHPYNPLPTVQKIAGPELLDARVVHLVRPDTTQVLAGGSGLVTVRVRIDQTGRVASAIIRSTSWDDALDEAALEAARATTFTPATIDGKAVAREYLLTDNYGGSDVPAFRTPPDVYQPKRDCSLAVDSAVHTISGKLASPDWYEIHAESNRTDILSAQVEFETILGAQFSQSWEHLALMPSADEPQRLETSAVLAWPGAPLGKIWISSYTLLDGSAKRCPDYYALAENSSDTSNPQTSVPSLPHAMTLHTEAAADTSLPIYPAKQLQAGTTGKVDVYVAVDARGKPTYALTARPSGDVALDASALDAAKKSHFPASTSSESGDVRIFLVEYEFADSPALRDSQT